MKPLHGLTIQPSRDWSFCPLVFGLALLLAGCAHPPVRGLRPIYPQVNFDAVGPPFMPHTPATAFVAITNVQPTMSWEAFPNWQDPEEGAAQVAASIQQVTYDVRIWRAEEDAPGELVYAKDALPQSSHQLEKPLQAATRYCWTVRARFLLNGKPRVSEWGFSQWPWPPVYNRHYGLTPRHTESIPVNNYYRFRTPR